MIRAANLVKRYGDAMVLDGLDFEVAAGERVAILGGNGAGKTTLFRCLLGLTSFEGWLEVAGLPAGPAAKEVRARTGYVPQQAPIYDLTLTGFLALFAALRGVPAAVAEERLEDLGLDLAASADRPLRELSGGMLQKAYLALALAGGAPVLLLDEPTASLDPASRREFVRLLDGIDRETTMLLASHRLEEIESIAERLVVLHAGRIVFDGDLGDLWRKTGTGTTLWIASPVGATDGLLRALADHPAVRTLHPNGAGVRIEADANAHLDVLADLRGRGVPVAELRTRPPALEDVLERLIGEEPAPEDGG